MDKHGFTLVEIVMVLIVIGILLVLVPLNLRWVENHVQLSLVTQKIEDTRDQVNIRMRQGRVFDTATLSLTTTWWDITYTWWIQGERKDIIVFEKPIELSQKNDNEFVPLADGNTLKWMMSSYGISCVGPDVPFKASYQGMQACYQVELNSCILKRMKCK